MEKHIVNLTDGSRLEVRVNFGTIYYLQKQKGFYRLCGKSQKKQKLTNEESFEMAAWVIYAILRSNGKAVTFDEALALIPPGTEEISAVMTAFQKEYEKYKKKDLKPMMPL